MKTRTPDSFYDSLQDFISLTSELIRMGDAKHLRICFSLIEKLLTNGEPMVQNAIRTIYVPSLHKFLDTSALRGLIVRLLPVSLRREFEHGEQEKEALSDIHVFVLHLN